MWDPINRVKSASVGGWDPINRVKSANVGEWGPINRVRSVNVGASHDIGSPIYIILKIKPNSVRIRFFLANNCFVFPRTY
jgi:hypothetical protein